jgi:hypothetical protein
MRLLIALSTGLLFALAVVTVTIAPDDASGVRKTRSAPAPQPRQNFMNRLGASAVSGTMMEPGIRPCVQLRNQTALREI